MKETYFINETMDITAFIRECIKTHFDYSNFHQDLQIAVKNFKEMKDKEYLYKYENGVEDFITFFYDWIERVFGHSLLDKSSIQYSYRGTCVLHDDSEVEYTMLFIRVSNEYGDVCRACLGVYSTDKDCYSVEYKVFDAEECITRTYGDIRYKLVECFDNPHGSYVCMVGDM